MLDMNEVMEGLGEWLDNPYWKAFYEEAPTEACKKYVAIYFYASDTEDEAAFEEMDKLEKDFGLSEWKHLLKFSGNTPEKAKIMKKIQELEG